MTFSFVIVLAGTALAATAGAIYAQGNNEAKRVMCITLRNSQGQITGCKYTTQCDCRQWEGPEKDCGCPPNTECKTPTTITEK